MATNPVKPKTKAPAAKSPVISPEVTIERDVLLRMMADQRFLSILSPLQTLKQKQQQQQQKSSCGCGNKTKPNLIQSDFETAKRQLANILGGNAELQKTLRDWLMTKTLRIKYVRADGTGAVVKKFS